MESYKHNIFVTAKFGLHFTIKLWKLTYWDPPNIFKLYVQGVKKKSHSKGNFRKKATVFIIILQCLVVTHRYFNYNLQQMFKMEPFTSIHARGCLIRFLSTLCKVGISID